MNLNFFKNYVDSNFFLKDLKKNNSILDKAILNSKVLVIGGAGTIGSNYIKQLLNFKPLKVVVVDTNENALTELTRDLRSSYLLDYNPEFITYPVDLLSNTFVKIFLSDHFDIIANFSAHKHVRSEKDQISVESLILNNVFGAIKLLELCSKRIPKYFFSVSTDKAANPVNIMGASKLIMEKLILSQKNKFRVSTARFANVAFSNGSLLDGFLYRINKKQPLSCPSDIRRFFVTPEQSGQICLLATFLGESGNIFFPKFDFDEQIYFKDIAIDFLKYNNLEPIIVFSEKEAKDYVIVKNKYPIYFFESDTSGEKLYEEFFTEKENYFLNHHESLGYIKSDNTVISFNSVINDFTKVFNDADCTKSKIVSVIKKYVKDFQHIEKGKNLDQKM